MKSRSIKVLLVLLILMYSCMTLQYINVSANDHAATTTTLTVTSTTKVSTTKPSFKKFKCYIKKNKIKVHSKANKKSKVVKTLYKGKKVTVSAIKGNWYKIGKDKWIHKNHISKKNPMGKYQGVQLKYMNSYNVTSNKLTRSKGVVNYKGHRETYYSQRVLSGSGLNIPGRHVANDGTIRDKDGYICISCNSSYKSKGSKLMTSLGPAKVYDCGVPVGTVDIYVDW